MPGCASRCDSKKFYQLEPFKLFRKTLSVSCVATCLAVSAVGTALADEATTISGKAFLDITNVDGTSDGNKTAASGTGFDAKRLYIGVDHKFDDMWSMQAVTDFNYISAIGQTDVYIKKLFVQAKLSDAFVLRAGSADLPWVPFVEDVYGYRWVENVIIDRLKFGTSADWGFNANGKMGGGHVCLLRVGDQRRWLQESQPLQVDGFRGSRQRHAAARA